MDVHNIDGARVVIGKPGTDAEQTWADPAAEVFFKEGYDAVVMIGVRLDVDPAEMTKRTDRLTGGKAAETLGEGENVGFGLPVIGRVNPATATPGLAMMGNQIARTVGAALGRSSKVIAAAKLAAAERMGAADGLSPNEVISRLIASGQAPAILEVIRDQVAIDTGNSEAAQKLAEVFNLLDLITEGLVEKPDDQPDEQPAAEGLTVEESEAPPDPPWVDDVRDVLLRHNAGQAFLISVFRLIGVDELSYDKLRAGPREALRECGWRHENAMASVTAILEPTARMLELTQTGFIERVLRDREVKFLGAVSAIIEAVNGLRPRKLDADGRPTEEREPTPDDVRKAVREAYPDLFGAG